MAAEAPAPRPRVVVTNHDPVFLGLLEELLREEGDEALVPPKLEEPYPFIKAVRPDAVVPDVPFRRETETLATLDKLRFDRATAALAVVVCTATPGGLEGLVRREPAAPAPRHPPARLRARRGRTRRAAPARPPRRPRGVIGARAARGESPPRAAPPGPGPRLRGGESPGAGAGAGPLSGEG